MVKIWSVLYRDIKRFYNQRSVATELFNKYRVYEGNPIVLMGDPMTNNDFTQTYLYGAKFGAGIVLAGGNAGIGRYKIS